MADRIDLRSDTATRPTQAMRQAMAMAEVGDDWIGEDPTVNRLQDRAAELTGKQAALYLPTGTLCTQITTPRPGAVRAPGGLRGLGPRVQHGAGLGGGAVRRSRSGGWTASAATLSADQVAAALAPDRYDVTVVDLVAIENTHQVAGGTVTSVADVAAVAKACDDAGVPLYLDGARIFNACTVAGVQVSTMRGM